MTKKSLAMSILIIFALGILAFAGFKIVNSIGEKKASEEADRKRDIEHYYRQQNVAFFEWGHARSYEPYNKKYEWLLQAHMNLYIRNTGKTITLADVETFLAISENPDGTPRTWKNDETGIVKDFVDWYWLWLSTDEVRFYKDELQSILTRYYVAHQDCPYTTLSLLTPEQIIELDKKYLDPDYDLVLE
jgi:hypothetical protein